MAAKRSVSYSDEDEADELPRVKKRTPLSGRPSPWSLGLLKSMEDPKKVLISDEKCVIIRDEYPKSRHHYLTIPKENISSLKSLDSSHVDLLQHMLEFSQSFNKSKHKHIEFRYGYHAVPSMTRLHMHVISQDFDSPCLKNKKHWNSFTTEFFIDAVKVIELLRSNGKIEINKEHYEGLLKRPLVCHICSKELKNIPLLKQHITTHL